MSKIVIVGDLFPVPTNITRFSNGDIDNLFGEKIISIFQQADYRICNLEGALTNRPGYCEKTGPVLFAPTKSIRAYKKLGIDCCTLANNHITDAGLIGVNDTIKTLNDSGICHIGAGSINNIPTHLFFKIDTLNVCLYNVAETMYNAPSDNCPGAHIYDEYCVCKDLESLKKACDYLIVIYHGGAEQFRFPSPQTRTRFHRMADSGADMILSQHTHCIGTEELYHGAYLLYGQGNFLFRSFNNEFTDTGLIIELNFEDGQATIKKYLVNAVADTVRYDEKQDFTEFDRRSSQIFDTKYIQELFDSYCLNELSGYLGIFKENFLFSKILRKFSKKLYRKYLLLNNTRYQMLKFLHTMRSEQNREVAINGIKMWLKENE